MIEFKRVIMYVLFVNMIFCFLLFSEIYKKVYVCMLNIFFGKKGCVVVLNLYWFLEDF